MIRHFKKKRLEIQDFKPFCVQKVGVEPTRMLSPQDFESSASAGSATSACRQSVVEKKPRLMEAFVGSEGFEPPTSCL